MPALLLHITVAKETALRPDVPAELAGLLATERAALVLGSILPDLPYHAHFGRQVVRHLLRREYLLTEWGDVLHTRGTGRLALAMLAYTRRQQLEVPARDKVLALIAGYLSHHALDRVVHPLINQLVQRHRLPGEPVAVVHSRMERYQSLLYHMDRLGFDITGTPIPRQMVGEMAGAHLIAPRLERPLWLALRGASLEVHGRAPTVRQVRDWLWGVTAYGWLMSSPAGPLDGLHGNLGVLRSTYYQGPAVDLVTPLTQAADLTVEYWRAALALLRADRIGAEARYSFLQRVPDVDFSTGA